MWKTVLYKNAGTEYLLKELLLMMGRVPPVEIRRELRREVGFGCPVQGCGSPFLEYHHFNPPWHEVNNHDIQGMIALCPSHHAMADQGAWSIEELTCLKAKNSNSIQGSLHWNLKNSIVNAGSNYLVVKDKLSLRVQGNEIFGLSQNEHGRITLNALLWDDEGSIIIQINDNDIIVAPNNIKDFTCNAAGNKIRIESIKSKACLEFTFKREKSHSLGRDITAFYEGEKLIPVINLKAKIINPSFNIAIQNKQIVLDFRRLGYDKAALSNRIIGPNGALILMVGEKEFIYFG